MKSFSAGCDKAQMVGKNTHLLLSSCSLSGCTVGFNACHLFISGITDLCAGKSSVSRYVNLLAGKVSLFYCGLLSSCFL